MNCEELWDAVVIGAGPAGSVAARELARRGARVLLVDRATFPRPKVCGCCLNEAALGGLAAVGLGGLARQCGAVPLQSVRLAAGRGAASLPLPGGVALSREAFDSTLIREAQLAGAELRTGTTAKLGETHPDRRTLTLSQGPQSATVAARIVILATGLIGNDGTPVAASRLGAGAVVDAADAPAFFTPGVIFMATGRGGYVGLVRLEDGRLDVAAAFDPGFVRSSGGLDFAAEAILAGVGWPELPGIHELPWKGTPALTRRPITVARHRLFAIGDAAGYVEPFTGEGMAWAVASAAAVAPLALRAVAAWNDDFIPEWERTHRRLLGGRQRMCRVVARVLRSSLLTRLAVRAIAAVPLLSRPVVSALNRPAVLPSGLPA